MMSSSCIFQTIGIVGVICIVLFVLAAPVYGVFIAVKCCRKRQKALNSTQHPYRNNTSRPLAITRISPPPLPPFGLDSLIREKMIIKAPDAVRVVVEQLVVKSWDSKLSGLGRDASGLSHARIEINNVYIVHNNSLKAEYEVGYDTALQRLLQIESTTSNCERTPIQTAQALSKIPNVPPDVFSLRTGETLLFHGTSRINVPEIIQHGLKAEKNTRSPYGKGTYLSDSAQKADQYTDTQGTRTNKGLTMFLVRVALGWTVKEEFRHLDCDTVVAGSGKLFQEFVAKRDDFLLPQILIEYNRV